MLKKMINLDTYLFRNSPVVFKESFNWSKKFQNEALLQFNHYNQSNRIWNMYDFLNQ